MHSFISWIIFILYDWLAMIFLVSWKSNIGTGSETNSNEVGSAI